MRDSLHDAPAPPRLPLLYFEYGADETTCEQGIEVSERGMCFHSRWQFAPGTQLGITVSFTDSEGNLQRAGMEAFVVECVPSECGCHRVTLLFLELEDRFRPALRSLRGLVADPRHSSAAGRRWRSRTV